MATDWLFLATARTVWLAAALPALNWIYGNLPVPLLSLTGLLCLGGLFLVVQAVLPLALTIAGLLTTALLRLLYSQAEIEAWIDNSSAFWPDPASQDEIEWHGRLCRRFTALLYGRHPPASDGRPPRPETDHDR